MRKPQVILWNEFYHEQHRDDVKAIYPNGIHITLQEALQPLLPECEITTAVLEEPEHGLSKERLQTADVIVWWGHARHGQVEDEIAARVQTRVLQGMGFVGLHSAHFAKPFKRLLGTGCGLRWRESGDLEKIWVTNPGHPIAQGIPEMFELEHEEMYGEPFGIPEPEEQVFMSWFSGGEVFRSGNCWHRGAGKIFYFRPGHETYPTYFDKNVQQVIANGIQWAMPEGRWLDVLKCLKSD